MEIIKQFPFVVEYQDIVGTVIASFVGVPSFPTVNAKDIMRSHLDITKSLFLQFPIEPVSFVNRILQKMFPFLHWSLLAVLFVTKLLNFKKACPNQVRLQKGWNCLHRFPHPEFPIHTLGNTAYCHQTNTGY